MPSDAAPGTRAEGDRELAYDYGSALKRAAKGERDVVVPKVAPHSTFGQWWTQLHDAFKSPPVRQWIQDTGIDPESIKLDPKNGEVSFSLTRQRDPKQVIHTLGQDDRRWASISGPILQAARVIAAGNGGASFAPPITTDQGSVPYALVGSFYSERPDRTESALRERGLELASDKGFKPLDPATASGLIESRSEDALQNQKAHLADTHDRQQIVNALKNLAGDVKNGTISNEAIEGELKRTLVDLFSDSTYQAPSTGPWKKASLLQLLNDHGWSIPTNREELENLATALSTPALNAPPHGNLGGALGWPVPLDQKSQEQLKADIRVGQFGDLKLAPFDNVLDYLLNGRAPSPEEQSNPRQLIDALISSPRGQALGQAIQTTFEARSVKGSASDWLLAALNVGTQRSATGKADSQAPGVIEGYRLVSSENIAKTPELIVKAFADHLLAKGIATSAAAAKVQAYLLLANQAPEFLLKDIPQQVTVGTHSWVSLTTAVARIEAKAPGATAGMSYAQIMLEAEMAPISEGEHAVEYAAQNEAIKQWGVANGADYPTTDTAIIEMRKVFSAQVNELSVASNTHIGDMPTTKSIALEQLKTAFPDMPAALFEKRTITLKPSPPDYPGPYSLLDVYIHRVALENTPKIYIGASGKGFSTVWVSSSEDINIDKLLPAIKQLPTPKTVFSQQFDDYKEDVKKVTTAHLKYLISNLPLEDRKNLEYGQITFKELNNYPIGNQPERVVSGALMIQTERNGNTEYYQFDRLRGRLDKLPGKNYYIDEQGLTKTKHKYAKYEGVKREGQHSAGLKDEKPGAAGLPDSFGSARTQYLVDTMFEDMEWPKVEKFASNQTTFDTEVPQYKKINRFLLGLIPFYSAIQNFKEGHIGAGLLDVALDVFGFVTAGAGAVAKGAKVAASVASTLSKIGKFGKIIGRAAIGAINPLDGVGGLAHGALKIGRKAAGAAHKGIKQLRGSYQRVNLLELAKKPGIAQGTYKTAKGAPEYKVLATFDDTSQKWYAYDPVRQQAYGKSLDNFVSDARDEVKFFADSKIGKMLGAIVAPPADNPYFPRDYSLAVTKAKTQDPAAYRAGYNTGKPEAIYGYKPSQTVNDLKRLAVAEVRTPAELGSLGKRIDELEALPIKFDSALQTAKAIDAEAFATGYAKGKPEGIAGFSEKLSINQLGELIVANKAKPEAVGRLLRHLEDTRVEIAKSNYTYFKNEIVAAGGEVVPFQQGFYLSQVSQLSEGECAALANLMAAAQRDGKHAEFLNNLHAAMVKPKTDQELQVLRATNPAKAEQEIKRANAVAEFRQDLNTFQTLLEHKFHLGTQSRQVPYTTIISELANAKSSKTLLIQAPGHGITAGVKFARDINGNDVKTWFYFDPNFGQATFKSEASMRAGLEKTLKSGETKKLLEHYGDNASVPEYKISSFDPVELNISTRQTGIDPSSFYQRQL